MKKLALTTLVVSLLVAPSLHAAAITGQGTWETTLQGRDLDGNLATFEAYYDTTLNITWLGDANYAGTAMNWSTANAWAASLNPYSSGITGWRLPTLSPIDGTDANDMNFSFIGTGDRGFNVSAPGTLFEGSTASEMAHLFYNTLGDISECYLPTSTDSFCDYQSGYGLSNTGPFSNLQSYAYWTDTEFAPYTNGAWGFVMSNGLQGYDGKSSAFFAWAVHDGDVGVAAVPVPTAVWLFSSGLIGLIGVARRKSCV